MSSLPSNFPTDREAISLADLHRVEWFYRQFIEGQYERYCFGHFLLAAYASIPAQLTPDLLYQIWQNFNSYKWLGEAKSIHRIAVADILLSPLCKEVGYELYEMHEEVKLGFLQWLHKSEDPDSVWATREIYGVNELATFIVEYHDKPNLASDRWGEDYRTAQKQDAVSYLNPREKLKEMFDDINKLRNEIDSKLLENTKRLEISLFQALDAIQRMKTRLEKINPKAIENIGFTDTDFERIEGWKALLQYDTDLLQNGTYQNFFSSLHSPNSIAVPSGIKDELVIKLQRKLKAFIVGVENSKVDINSAALFASALKESVDNKDIEVLQIKQTTKSNIIAKLADFAKSVNALDDVVFYIAANARPDNFHCYIQCSQELESDDESNYIADEKIFVLLAEVKCASLTMIIQTDHAGTPHWLDTNKPNHIVFASSRFDQAPEHYTISDDGTEYCVFTYALAKTMRSHKLKLSNKQLFTETLRVIGEFERQPKKTPQLLGNRNSYNLFFAQGSNRRVALQNLLRQTGFSHEISSGNWDENTATALTDYKKYNHLSGDLSYQELINRLEERKQQLLVEEPKYLLIFSDPYSMLRSIQEERTEILKTLAEYRSQVIILDNPSKAELINVLKNKENRNKIELVYYSGRDLNGNLVLSDSAFNILDFGECLDFQENIGLFISNTCRSQHFADFMTQLGVGMAIGAHGIISDEFGMQFGIGLFGHLISNGDVKSYIENFKETYNGYRTR